MRTMTCPENSAVRRYRRRIAQIVNLCPSSCLSISMDDTLLNRAHRAGQKALISTYRGDLKSAVELQLQAASLLKTLQANLPPTNPLKGSLEYFIQDYERQARITNFLLIRDHSSKQPDMSENRAPGPGPGGAGPSPSPAPRQGPGILAQGSPSKGHFEVFNEQYDSLLPLALRPGQPNYTLRPRNSGEVSEEQELIISNLRLLVETQATEIQGLKNQLYQAGLREQDYKAQIQQLKQQLQEQQAKSAVPDQ